ncbi:hypothetical protein [Tindallia californiensis]|uniref:Uncharacterized protein n=1 Tax=Tindallia californiensis TaxID=159292 RepID=A0A1H3QZ07_9FIRM|nr:hypothetical protein [Tindallia californiensis]SDZ18667.1 hypothetical protein SAMN05192546_11140 [Tindallia californiensis]
MSALLELVPTVLMFFVLAVVATSNIWNNSLSFWSLYRPHTRGLSPLIIFLTPSLLAFCIIYKFNYSDILLKPFYFSFLTILLAFLFAILNVVTITHKTMKRFFYFSLKMSDKIKISIVCLSVICLISLSFFTTLLNLQFIQEVLSTSNEDQNNLYFHFALFYAVVTTLLVLYVIGAVLGIIKIMSLPLCQIKCTSAQDSFPHLFKRNLIEAYAFEVEKDFTLLLPKSLEQPILVPTNSIQLLFYKE